MALTFREYPKGCWRIRDELTRQGAHIDSFKFMHEKDKYYVVTLHDDTKMRFDSLEEAKAWASIALRT
jgi:hypothetical protein